jgi:hypothetical protein
MLLANFSFLNVLFLFLFDHVRQNAPSPHLEGFRLEFVAEPESLA